MIHSDTIGKLAEALSKAQGAFSHVEKDGKSHHGKYATLPAVLDVVRGPLSENGLSMVQAPSSEGNVVTVTTRLMHVSGEWLETSISSAANADIQKLGSAISYLRRYSIMAVLSIAADDDDDGNTAATKAPQRQQAPRPAPAPQPAAPATIGTERAQGLQKQLSELLGETSHREKPHTVYAGEVIEREVKSLSELTPAEAKAVYTAAQSAQQTAA